MKWFRVSCDVCGEWLGPRRASRDELRQDGVGHRCENAPVLPEEVDDRWLMTLAQKVARAYCRRFGLAADDEMVADAVIAGWRYLPRWEEGGRTLEAYLWERMTYGIVDGRRNRGPYKRKDYALVREAGEDGLLDGDVLLPWKRPPMSLDELRTPTGNRAMGAQPVPMFDLADPRGSDGFREVEVEDLARWLLEQLHDEREREVVERVVLREEVTLAALGAEWGVTESRVCQIKRKALDRMWIAAAEVGADAA